MAVHAHFYPDNLAFPFPAASPDCLLDYGCGAATATATQQFSFNLQHKPPLLNQTQCLPGDADADGDGSVVSFSKNPHRPATFSQCVTVHVEKQRQEIDHYIRLQNESLRMALREQGKQQVATLLRKIELKTAIMLRHKEEEIAQAAKKTMELEIFLRKLETENQLWQRIAQENEAMAISLNNRLDQMREERVSNSLDDAESCCDINVENSAAAAGGECEAPASNRGCSVSEQGKNKMICRGCNCRNSTVIFLPCRHLCSCKNCESVLDSCPVCETPKKATIEALIF